MSDFKPGWYAVKRLHDGAVDNWYFETRERVTLTARMLPNGHQIPYFRHLLAAHSGALNACNQRTTASPMQYEDTMRHHTNDQNKIRNLPIVARLLIALALLATDRLQGRAVYDGRSEHQSLQPYRGLHPRALCRWPMGNSYPYGGGGSFVCCITYPRQWHPGLTAKVRWTTSSGIPGIRSEPVWHEKVVPIERYEKPGTRLNVHFLPEGKVRLLIWNGAAGSKGYKGPDAPVKPDNWPPLPPPPILPDAKSEHTDAEHQP